MDEDILEVVTIFRLSVAPESLRYGSRPEGVEYTIFNNLYNYSEFDAIPGAEITTDTVEQYLSADAGTYPLAEAGSVISIFRAGDTDIKMGLVSLPNGVGQEPLR